MCIIETITNNEIKHDSRLKKFLRNTVLFTSMTLGTIFAAQKADAQYNVHVKAASLDQTASGTPIAGAVISKDQGDVVKVTDANGDAILTNVGGSMSIKALHPDYKQFEQTFNITKDTTIYFAMPKTIRDGNWGRDTLNADWWKYIYRTATAAHDPTRWKQIIPVNTQISGASHADSIQIFAAVDTMEKSTGYKLFNFIKNASIDTIYTIYMNAGSNISEITPDTKWIATNGYSDITSSDPVKITHEIVQSQDGWATGLIPVPTNANPMLQTRPPWQKLDGSYLSLKLEQDFRKKNGKQSLMIFNMQNYAALGNVGIVPVVSPANNSVDVDTLLNIIGTKDANTTIEYDFKITTDIAGNNIVISQNGIDRPRTNVILEPGKDYYIFERANGSNIGPWSTPNKISTKAKPIIVGAASIASPLNNATKVLTPTQYIINPASNAILHEIVAALDNNFNTIIKDTLVSNLNPVIPLPNGKVIYTEIRGVNGTITGPWSPYTMITTIKATPSLISILNPLNNAVEVVQPTNIKSSTGGTSAEGYKYEVQTKDGVPVFDTATIANEFYKKLDGNREFRIRGWAVNSDVEGPKSAWVYFKSFNNAPGNWSITLINNAVISYVNKKLAIPSTPATDIDNDVVTKNFHVVGPSLDTIMHANNIETIYLDSARLKLDSQYTISGEATDGSKITPANEVITIKTPKATTGIEDIFRQGDFLIYPNPANQDITIEYYLLQNLEINICLYSLDGKKLISQSYDKSTGSQIHRMNLSSVEKGIFIIKLMTRDSGKERLIITFKLIRN
jgi:Secretion system C-terminal sorting domain